MKMTLRDGRVVEGTVEEIRQLVGVTRPASAQVRRQRRVIPPHNCDDSGVGCHVCVGDGEDHCLKLDVED